MKERSLINELKLCFVNWDGDFDISVQQDDADENHAYFSVIVSHKYLGEDYYFTARVDSDGDCEMDFSDDSWHDINMSNIFAWMWFETANRRQMAAVE